MNTLPMVPRDRWQRPLITPVGGGKPEPYTRCTTFVGALEDTYNLEKWKMRMTAIGLASRPDLVMAVAACNPNADKDALNAHCESALQAAQASAAANVGTALHKFTETADRGELDVAAVPAEYRPDIAAYLDVMRQAKLTVEGIEQFVVHDDLKIGGTFDRTVTLGKKRYVLDVKTGTLEYGMGKIAMQLAVYAHARHYHVDTFERTDLNVDLQRAIICHLPAGTGKCFLRWVDIETGWEAVDLARQVRDWRKRKNLSEVFEYASAKPEPGPDPLMQKIADATSVTELRTLWIDNQTAWTPAHTEASKSRKTVITN